MHEPYFRPWGTVSPDYWTTGDNRSGPVPANSSTTAPVSQQAPPAGEQAPTPPANQLTKEPENLAPNAPAAPTPTPDSAPAQASTTTDEAEQQPPEAFRDRIAAVTAAFNNRADRDVLAAASIEAEKLDQELTAQYGEQHTYTVNIREIRGWLAHLTGQPGVAARWYLHTTGLQIALHGAKDAHTEGSVRRAIHTWQQVKDPAEVVQIGGDLAKVAAAVLGEGSDVTRFTQARLAHYQSQQ